MNLTIFDLDHTLIPIDSEMEWLRFLARRGAIANTPETEGEMQKLESHFAQGTLSDDDYVQFVYGLQRGLSVAKATQLREVFLHEVVKPQITDSARQLVRQHQAEGDLVMLITGSSAFMTAPIVSELGIAHGIGTTSTHHQDVFTGGIEGVPTFGHGKVLHLNEFLKARSQRLEDFAHSRFYSDSTYDLPLLERVHEPIATNPKPALKRIADERGWRTLHLW